MTVTALVTRNDITATSGQATFTYTFMVLDATDMDVYQNGVLLSSGYTVNNVGNTTGGTVVLDVGALTGQIVSLVLAMPLDRTTDYQNSGDFLASDVNADFDKIYVGAIQNENWIDRGLRLQEVEPPTAGVDMTLPLKADRLGKFLAFDSVTGGPIAGSGAAFFDSAAWSVYDFTGDGTTVAFTLGSDPATENNTQVYIDGVYQEKDGYSVTGAVLTFSVAPLNLTTIEVMVVAILPVGSTLDQPTRADLVSYTPANTGAVTTTVQAKLRETVSAQDFGAVGDGVADDTVALQAAFSSGANFIELQGTFKTTAPLTYSNNGRAGKLYGNATISYQGVSAANDIMLQVQCVGFSFEIDGITFNGNDLVTGGVRIENGNAMDSDTLPVCTFQNNTVINIRMLQTAIYNQGVFIRGSFERVMVHNNNIRNITRVAGTGTPAANGTSGIAVTQLDADRFVKSCVHTNNSYSNISGGDLLGSSNNVDYDGFIFFTKSPLNYTNSDGSIYRYSIGTLSSNGNTYRNCRGRAIKVQAIGDIRNEKVIRDDGYGLVGGSSEINLQYGVGTVQDCDFFYTDYLVGAVVTSPIQTGLTLISFYQGAWYNENSGSITVKNINVFNSIKAGVGNNLSAIVGATDGAVPQTKDRPLIYLKDINVNNNPISWILTIKKQAGARGLIRMDGIVIPELIYSAIGTDTDNDDVQVNATNIMHLDGYTTPANSVPFVTDTSPAGGNKSLKGTLSGSNNLGFLNTYNRGADFSQAPMLTAGIMGNTGQAGGALSVQTAYLVDDATYTFERRGFTAGTTLISIGSNYGRLASGIVASQSGGGVFAIALDASHVFSLGAGTTNPDTAGKVNLWIDTNNLLNIKNRLGSTQTFTLSVLG